MKYCKPAVLAAIAAILSVTTAHADHTRYQSSNVIDVSGANNGYQGAAWLVRSEDGIRGQLASRVSTAGDPYTLWIVVFNNPAECGSTPCSPSDLGTAEAGASVFAGTGVISAPDGVLRRNGKPSGGGAVNMDFVISAGELPSGLFLLFGDPVGLWEGNGFGAEIHLVIDKHPSIQPGMSWLADLTTTNFPNMGPATNDAVAIFLGCTADPCPDGVL